MEKDVSHIVCCSCCKTLKQENNCGCGIHRYLGGRVVFQRAGSIQDIWSLTYFLCTPKSFLHLFKVVNLGHSPPWCANDYSVITRWQHAIKVLALYVPRLVKQSPKVSGIVLPNSYGLWPKQFGIILWSEVHVCAPCAETDSPKYLGMIINFSSFENRDLETTKKFSFSRSISHLKRRKK